MATFLRVLIGLLTAVYLQVLVFGGALVVVLGDARVNGWAVLALTFGGLLIALPSSVAGMLVSYYTWGEDSRARVRRLAVTGAATAVAGLVLLVAGGIAAGAAAWFVAVLAVAGLALAPASISLGRAARGRTAPGAGRPVDERVFRDGRRNGAIGALIGFAVGGVLLVALALPAHRFEAGELFFAVVFAAYGGATGMITKSFTIQAAMRSATGTDLGGARRIGRIVRGKEQASSPEELARAVQYARWLRRFFPYNLQQALLLEVGAVGNVGVQALGRHRDGFIIGAAIVVLVAFVLSLAFIPFTARRARRAEAFAAEHAAA